MNISSHFRRHGGIHAFWIFSVLILIIAALMLKLPDGNLINNYISFASSVASLILAVVAIFYSMISNQNFSESVGSIRDSVKDLSAASSNVEAVTASLSDKSEILLGELVSFKPTMEEISTKLNAQSAPQVQLIEPDLPDNITKSGLIKSSPSQGGIVALYIVAKAILNNKKFSVEEIFESNAIWDSYCSGSIEALKTIQPCGIEIDRFQESSAASIGDNANSSDKTKWVYSIKNKGNFDPSEILTHIATSSYNDLRSYQNSVDAYFAK